MRILILNMGECINCELAKGIFKLEEILIDNKKGNSEELLYYKSGKYLLEYMNLKGDFKKLQNNIIKKKIKQADKFVITCNEINSYSISIIKKLIFEGKDPVIFCEKINLEEKELRYSFVTPRKLILAPQFFAGKDIKLLLKVIIAIEDIRETPMFIGYGKGEYALGEIVMKILENFKYMQKYKNIKVTLFPSKELNMEELTYIEDPLNEYIIENNKLFIEQKVDVNLKDTMYFFVKCTS